MNHDAHPCLKNWTFSIVVLHVTSLISERMGNKERRQLDAQRSPLLARSLPASSADDLENRGPIES